jgi:hypothetical protein
LQSISCPSWVSSCLSSGSLSTIVVPGGYLLPVVGRMSLVLFCAPGSRECFSGTTMPAHTRSQMLKAVKFCPASIYLSRNNVNVFPLLSSAHWCHGDCVGAHGLRLEQHLASVDCRALTGADRYRGWALNTLSPVYTVSRPAVRGPLCCIHRHAASDAVRQRACLA